MKFLFVIQGEGRGHFMQADALQKILEKKGHEIVGILVGKNKHREIPSFFADKCTCKIYPFESLGFLPSPTNKKPSPAKSILYNTGKINRFFRSMQFIDQKIKELQPDRVVNFYELLTSLTYILFRPNVPLFCIGHQYVFIHPHYIPPPTKNVSYKAMVFYTYLTGICAEKKLALSFYDMENTEKIRVVPPLLREEITTFSSIPGNYIHGYMLNAGFADEVITFFRNNPNIRGHFFWDKKGSKECETVAPGLQLHRLNDRSFLTYMSECKAYATTAGFESVCEALYLGKPVLMVPSHIEQECNAYDAVKVGAGVISDHFDISKLLEFIPSYKPDNTFRSRVDNQKERFAAILTEDIIHAEKRKKNTFGFGLHYFHSHRFFRTDV